MTTLSRPGPTVRVGVSEHLGSDVRRHEDRVAAEEPLELRLGWPGRPPRQVWVTMRTPGHDFELAAGWLVHEGVAAATAIHSVAYCTEEDLTPAQEFNVVTITLSVASRPRPGEPVSDPRQRVVGLRCLRQGQHRGGADDAPGPGVGRRRDRR